MKSENWHSSKTLVSGVPWGSTATPGSVRVQSPPGRVSHPDRLSGAHPKEGRRSFERPSDLMDWAQPQGGIRSWIKAIIANVLISPSFLLSSLLVFLFVPDAFLKGKYSLRIKEQAVEALRRTIDIVGAGILLVINAPLFLIIPIMIKLDSPGSIIYKQLRVGQNRRRENRRRNSYHLKGDRRNGDRRNADRHGKLFVVYKFRSMRQDAEKKSGPVWARKGDPRITKVGKLLRASRTDELPQLINIIKGDMSLVGPRPERPFFVDQFTDQISLYKDRLRVKPGLTGLAQVIGGYDTCVEDVYAKLNYDLRYIARRSLGQDIKILLKTIGVVLSGKGVYE